MALLPEEKETHISITNSNKDSCWDLYTTENTMMTKMKNLGFIPMKEDHDSDGEVIARYYEIPFKQIIVAKTRKKSEISDERRQELKDNMAKIHANKKKKKEEQS